MATIKLSTTTTATPEKFIAALTDFGPGRSEIWGLTDPKYQQIHHVGDHTADVTEGSGGIWERLAYDWSKPGVVRMTTKDSNTWGGESGHVYRFSRTPDGKTKVDIVVIRQGKNAKGKIVGAILGLVGTVVVGKQLKKTVSAIEARA